MSIGFSLDCGVRVIGSLNGIMYVEKRKMNGENVESGLRSFSHILYALNVHIKFYANRILFTI